MTQKTYFLHQNSAYSDKWGFNKATLQPGFGTCTGRNKEIVNQGPKSSGAFISEWPAFLSPQPLSELPLHHFRKTQSLRWPSHSPFWTLPPSPLLTKPSPHKHTSLNLISPLWDLHLWYNSVNVKGVMARTHLGPCVQLLCSRLEELTFLHHTQIRPGLSILW